jgi:hypothetical protein
VARVAQPDQLDFIIADLTRFAREEVVALGLDVVANLQDHPPRGTPIDTGWASANWIPSVGAPDETRVKDKDPTPADVAAARARGKAGLNEVLAWDFDDGAIFASNNVRYIRPLNEGHSTQSPPGFVQTALERAVLDAENRRRSPS